MKYEITFAPEAVDDFTHLSVRERTITRDAIEVHLKQEPGRISRGSIKRLRGLGRPQYRLRVGELSVFYDVSAPEVRFWPSW